MTDTPTSLAPGSIYRQADNVLLMAESQSTLRPIKGGVQRYITPDTVVYANEGSEFWVSAMRIAWEDLIRESNALQARNRGLATRLQNLGEALLEKAEEKGWCDEYEEFADEWDLPKRTKDYWVTICVQVEARDSEEARSLASKDYTQFEYDIQVEERGD